MTNLMHRLAFPPMAYLGYVRLLIVSYNVKQ